ncbi:MAG TPA: phosphatase PAP2 family protein [Candidatus Marinimicrobia bacterium]|nr:phosphatase PAP2 family protein [Candidatus Neomarinimicrobiota bacterium]
MQVIDLLQDLDHPAIFYLMRFVSLLGDDIFYVVLFPTIFWFWKRSKAVRLTVLLCTSIYINFVLKEAFQLPRPENVGFIEADGFSFPSGHAQHAVVLWGYLAWTVRKHFAFASFTSFFIGLSRLYLGVHWPGDVVGGWVIGATLLVLFILLSGKMDRSRYSLSAPPVAGILVVVTLWLGLFSSVTYSGIVMGALLGLIAGATAANYVNIPSFSRSTIAGAMVVTIGAAGLYGIYRVVSSLRDGGEGALFTVLAVIGFWISLGAPWLSGKVVEIIGLEVAGEETD